MNIDQLREQLIIDEGQVNEIYLDHLGYCLLYTSDAADEGLV